jgi:hypothetical protein
VVTPRASRPLPCPDSVWLGGVVVVIVCGPIVVRVLPALVALLLFLLLVPSPFLGARELLVIVQHTVGKSPFRTCSTSPHLRTSPLCNQDFFCAFPRRFVGSAAPRGYTVGLHLVDR